MKASFSTDDEFLYVSQICRWLIASSRLVPPLRFLPPPIRPVVKWFNRVELTSPICEVLVLQIDSKTPPISSKQVISRVTSAQVGHSERDTQLIGAYVEISIQNKQTADVKCKCLGCRQDLPAIPGIPSFPNDFVHTLSF